MKIIAFSNNKGGVGKTTSVVNVAAALEQLKYKVLVLDLDHQSQATYHLGVNPHDKNKTIYEVLKKEISWQDALVKRGNIDVIPATSSLGGIEFLPIPAKEFLLKESLEDLSGYDFVLIDCPPSLGVTTLNALTISDAVIVPLQVQFLPFHGMYNLFEAVDTVHQRLNPKIRVAGIIGTMYSAKKTINKEVLAETEDRLPGKLFETKIRDNVSLQEAPSWGKSIFEYAPESKGAKDYLALTKEIVERMK